MRLLVLGGTVFLGRHFVGAALQAGHEVTIFTRGKRNPDLFPEAERLRGDRTQDLSPLEGRTWDAVLDTSGYFPRDARGSATLLAPNVEHYTFVSTMSVYSEMAEIPGVDENGTLATTEDVDATEITGENYGALKALCEQEVERALPGRTLIIRPGLIVGPYDPSDRFTYWPVRIARGGEVLAPGSPEEPVQLIDARDLAEWTLRMIEKRQTGTYNASGAAGELTFGDVIHASRDAAGSDASVAWADGHWLVEQGVKPWIEMPLWVPNAPGFSRGDCTRAIDAGLTFRPIAETARDTLEWARTRPEPHEWRAGLTPEREAELLEAWKARTSAA